MVRREPRRDCGRLALYAVSRRLLPLSPLLGLSLVSRTRRRRGSARARTGTVESLEERLRQLRRRTSRRPGSRGDSPAAGRARSTSTTRSRAGIRARARPTPTASASSSVWRPKLDRLNWAALLHDVGKLDVSTEILNKPGKPTDEEWAQLRRHPLVRRDARRAAATSGSATWTDAVGYHHENWDGKGYPRGIAGEEIPLAGRIVAIADVYDVITSARSYKESASPPRPAPSSRAAPAHNSTRASCGRS